MTERNLSINLNTFGEKETPWIHLIQEDVPTDEIDQQQAAEIIDAAFDVVPCFEGETGSPAVTQAEKEREERIQAGGQVQEVWENIADIMKRIAGATFCEQNEDGGWDLIIRVAVSDRSKPYTLLIDGGVIGTTQVVSETVSDTKLIENSSQFTFDFPVLSNAVFECPVPFVIDGSTVYFENSVTTHLSYSYQTQYDRVTITTKPEYTEISIPSVQGGFLDLRKYDNGQIGQLIEKPCTVTGLYAGKSRQITLELPEIDESIDEPEAICFTEEGSLKWEFAGGARVCYEEITHITDCQCGDRTYPGERQRTEKKVVPCPEKIKTCPAINPGCTSILSRTNRHHYVPCPDVFDTWDGDTAEFYEEKCCESPKVTLPKCKIRTTTYVGGKPIKEDEQHWIDHYSYADVSFHPVTPQNGVCGKTIVEQVLIPKNCCEFATPLVDPNGDLVVGDNSSVYIRVEGGIRPLTWKVRTTGAFFDGAHTIRDAITAGEGIHLYTADVCGTIYVHVTDGCSTLSIAVRAEDGQWVQVDYWDYNTHLGIKSPPCIEGTETTITTASDMDFIRKEGGAYKLEEYIKKNTSVFLGGSPYTGYPTYTWQIACALTKEQVPLKTETPCCSANYNYPNQIYDPACCDSQRCYPSACIGTCSGGYCFYCGDRVSYHYWGSGTWQGLATSVWRAWLYKWEC